MKEKIQTNFAILMDLLDISTVALSKELNIERTSISRWRHGVNKIKVDSFYFEKIISYFAEKNKQLGNELLEDFFESIYPVKKRIHKDYLMRCIRSYILGFSDAKLNNEQIKINTNPQRNTMQNVPFTKYMGISGRMDAFLQFISSIEKLSVPSTVKIFEAEEMNWIGYNMNYSTLFYQKLKGILNAGHKVEIIFQQGGATSFNKELYQYFIELIFHDNLTHYLYFPSPHSPAYIGSMYISAPRIAISVYCTDNQSHTMSAFSTNDKHYIDGQIQIFEKCKRSCQKVEVTSNTSNIQIIVDTIKQSIRRSGECFHSGKELSIVTMSDDLLTEILDNNSLNKGQKKICYDVYHALRASIECSNKSDSMGGLYYVLDEITAPLAHPTFTNFCLSAITGKSIQMTREQYQRHFMDTAILLKQDPRYRVHLHYSPIPVTSSTAYPSSIWYKQDEWVLLKSTDAFSLTIKYSFSESTRTTDVFQIGFREIIEHIPDHKRDHAYVAQIFEKIALDEETP